MDACLSYFLETPIQGMTDGTPEADGVTGGLYV
jgi:hypothetical protein